MLFYEKINKRLKNEMVESEKINQLRKEKVRYMNDLKNFNQFLKEEDGMGTVEVILIIVVLVGLVIIFKDRITEVVENLFNKITSQTGRV